MEGETKNQIVIMQLWMSEKSRDTSCDVKKSFDHLANVLRHNMPVHFTAARIRFYRVITLWFVSIR